MSSTSQRSTTPETRQQQQRSIEQLEAEFAEAYEELCVAREHDGESVQIAKLDGRVRYLSTLITTLGGNTRRVRRAVHYSAKL